MPVPPKPWALMKGFIPRLIITGMVPAIGLVMPVTYIINAFANLCGTGGAPLCAIARGQGDDKRASRIMGPAP